MAFFQDTQPRRQPFLSAPATVLVLIGVLLAAHGARVLAPAPWPDMLVSDYAFIPARYAAGMLASHGFAPPGLFERVVPFVSYIFLHGNWTHVGINCLWLLAFGPIVTRRLGAVRFLVFFLICGVFAALAQLVAAWGSFDPVVGASGSISGLMAAGMRILYGVLEQRAAPEPLARPPLAPLLSRPILGFSVMWVIINYVSGVVGIGLTDDLASIAWVAHLGGYFAGLVLIGLFDWRRPESATPSA